MFKNTVLKALGDDVIERLKLRPVTFAVERELEYPGTPIDKIYFVEEGMASMTVTFYDGTQVEVGMFGCESIIGISALMGTKQSLTAPTRKSPAKAIARRWSRRGGSSRAAKYPNAGAALRAGPACPVDAIGRLQRAPQL